MTDELKTPPEIQKAMDDLDQSLVIANTHAEAAQKVSIDVANHLQDSETKHLADQGEIDKAISDIVDDVDFNTVKLLKELEDE